MNDRLINRYLRHTFSGVGWSLVIYYFIMEVLVSANQMVVFLFEEAKLFQQNLPIRYDVLWDTAAADGWGYFAAAITGLIVLFGWKGAHYWKNTIWSSGKPMTFSRFFQILSVFLGMQLIGSIITEGMNFFFQFFGLDVTAFYALFENTQQSLSMFLYASILAPITEEILFRGFVQKALRSFGRNFAITCSAFTFGLFHGNLMQAPFAFLAGLVLGYVADEYSIGWCMLLHMVNNLVLADLLPRLLLPFSDDNSVLIQNLIIILFAICGAVVLFRSRNEILHWIHWQPMDSRCIKCFFSCSGIIAFVLLFGASMVFTLVAFS